MLKKIFDLEDVEFGETGANANPDPEPLVAFSTATADTSPHTEAAEAPGVTSALSTVIPDSKHAKIC